MFLRLISFVLAFVALAFCARGYLQLHHIHWDHYYEALSLGAIVAALGFGSVVASVWTRKKRLEASGWMVLKAWLRVESLLLGLYLLGLGGLLWYWRDSSLSTQTQLLRQLLLLGIYALLARLLIEPGRSKQVLRGFEQGWSQPISLKRQNYLDVVGGLLILLSALALQGYLVRHWIL